MACGSYEIIREGEDVTVRVDCENCTYFPSLEDEPRLMSMTMDILAEAGTVTKLQYVQKRDIEYDYTQVQLLTELATLYKQLLKQKITQGLTTAPQCAKWTNQKYIKLQEAIHKDYKADPLGTYVTLKRLKREEQRQQQEHLLPPEATACLTPYYQQLDKIIQALENTRIIHIAAPYLAGLTPGDRAIYRLIFTPTIKPDFMFTKLMSSYPADGEEIDSYQIGNTEITIFKQPETVQNLYHVNPTEFTLTEEKYELLDAARKILAEHKPKRSEFVDPERMRDVFTNVAKDLLDELSEHKNIHLRTSERDELAEILVRYTVGMGLIEVLLQDENIQDITINSPMGRTPMFIVHSKYGECTTNIIPTTTEGESWASKLRMISGRPLDEANPILDTELIIPAARARVAAITAPLNPTGLAYALRRHRDKPWTLPLFIKNKMISPLAAGLISFLVDGSRTILVAGTRSAGKSSVLGSIMVEIMRKNRVITIEDTLELPVTALKKLNYNIQSMKVASALTRGTTEVNADEGIRTTLRLGDSALIVGEVRSTEAQALYEAMRVGALANVVAGTIHGDSPYGVYDRVVNDLKVPKTSFKATDIIIVANPIRTPDGLHKVRRITQITEVRKQWEDDPLRENGFVDLMKYNPETDSLEPTTELLRGDSDILKNIASTVKEWSGNWDAIWDNILLRTKIKETLTKESETRPDIIEAEFYITANDMMHQITDKIIEETGKIDTEKIYFEWNQWLKRALKR